MSSTAVELDRDFGDLAKKARDLTHLGLEREEIHKELRKLFPRAKFHDFTCAILAAAQQKQRNEENSAEAPSDEPRPAPYPSAPADGGTRGEFGHACLPLEEVNGGKIIIPVLLARATFAFSASRHGKHVLDLENLKIEVGGNGYESLTTNHLTLFFALLKEAQNNGMAFASNFGEKCLEVKTSISALQKICNQSPFGGSSQRRIEKQLEELGKTPVIFSPKDGSSRSNYPLIKSISKKGSELTIRIHWKWSEGFADKTKKGIKPFLLSEFLKITSPIDRLAYVHLDWALAKHKKAELLYATLLERVGAFNEDNSTAEELKKYPGRQRLRLAYLWQLNGLLLSSGEKLSITEAQAQVPGARHKSQYKLVATRAIEPIPESLEETEATEREEKPGATIIDLAFYRRHRNIWMQKPRSAKVCERRNIEPSALTG